MMSAVETTRQAKLKAHRDAVLSELLAHVERRAPLVILRAPPGSGKTYASTYALALSVRQGRRVAVATFTNAQADELAARLAKRFPSVCVVRWVKSGGESEADCSGARVVDDSKDIPAGPCVVVATATKWAMSKPPTFDALFVDEAWQITWADFTLLGKLAPTFVLVGDPGQIEPVVTTDVARWETSRRPPHRAAPDVLLADGGTAPVLLSLPVTSRLPYDSARLVQRFYDFEFDSWCDEGERSLSLSKRAGGAKGDAIDAALESLGSGSVTALTLPTPDEGPSEDDPDLALTVADLVRRALARGATAVDREGARVLAPEHIGVVATHRAMNARIALALGELAGRVKVDTPERWQGLERELMVAVHPLSGTRDLSGFGLTTGRLCVMASRHKYGLVLVSRDHVGDTLRACVPPADHRLGTEDDAGRGLARHEGVWQWLVERGRVVAA